VQADRKWIRGRLIRMGEKSEEGAQPLHRGSGGSTYTRKAHATREAQNVVRDHNRTPARDSRALWVAEVRSVRWAAHESGGLKSALLHGYGESGVWAGGGGRSGS